MKLLVVLGARPQYVKFKPICDFLIYHNIDFYVIDTGQHYDDSISKSFIRDLKIRIDYTLDASNTSSIKFISEVMMKIDGMLKKINPSILLVMGDTNSTLAGALVASKNNIFLAHLEAGQRCWDKNRPEEINRIITDEIASIHFVSSMSAIKNVSNPVFTGDMEYFFLNECEKNGIIPNITYEDWYLMTIHRTENTSVERLEQIFDMVRKINKPIHMPIHHRTDKVIKNEWIKIPDNIIIHKPFSYFEMINAMASCRAIISDSGGIIKTSPFFGKKCLIPLESTEWPETVSSGYSILGNDLSFIERKPHVERNKDMYYNPKACELIERELIEIHRHK